MNWVVWHCFSFLRGCLTMFTYWNKSCRNYSLNCDCGDSYFLSLTARRTRT
jgi:hypothetical protein